MNAWTVKMRGGLQVEDPAGEHISFPTRKTGALLAVLAIKQGHAIRRIELADILWPESPAKKQMVSLRQAIRNLQISLGAASPVIVHRDTCRIDPDVVETPDLVESPGVLLPEMTEPWFDDVRRAEGSVEPVALGRDSGIWSAYKRQTTAALGLLDAMEWASINRPRECLRIARYLPELIENAPPHRLAAVLDRALAVTRTDDPLYGWGIALRGMANILIGHMSIAEDQFSAARQRALVAKDRGLYVMSSFYLTASQILCGEHEKALATITEAKRTRLDNVDPYAAVRLRHGLGLALCHHGEFRRGIRELWIAHDESSERTAPYEHAYVTANLSLFEASVGSISKAKGLIKELRDLPAGDSSRLELTSLMAQAFVAYRERRHDECREICERTIEICESLQVTGVNIYAYELMARNAFETGKRSEADEFIRRAVALRKQAQYGTTVWDRERLGPLAGKLP